MGENLLIMVMLNISLAALLVLMLLYSRIPLLIKILMVAVLPAFYLLSWNAWKNAEGWPSLSDLPLKFQLHSALIEEPDPVNQTEGKIELWITDLSSNFPQHRPRAYEINYSEELHGRLDEALRKMRNGHIQLGTQVEGDLSKTPPKDFSRLGEKRYSLEFTKLPDPALPEK